MVNRSEASQGVCITIKILLKQLQIYVLSNIDEKRSIKIMIFQNNHNSQTHVYIAYGTHLLLF